MKLITSAGVIRSARRFISGANNVSEDEMSDNKKVAEIIRKMSVRIAELEARVAKEGTEFEVVVGNGGALSSIQHNMRGPVRYMVVSWCRVDGQASPISAPVLVRDDTSTATTLVLRSYVAGRAIVRVEPAFADIDPGVAVGDFVPALTPVTSFAPGAASSILTTIGTTPAWAAAKAISYASLSSNVTINVASYATLLTANITTTTTSGAVNIAFSAAATNTVACSVFFQVLVDSFIQKGVRVDIAAGGGGNGSAVMRVTGLSPGSHTVLLQWKTNVNGASIHAATVIEEHASLLVEETV